MEEKGGSCPRGDFLKKAYTLQREGYEKDIEIRQKKKTTYIGRR